MKKLICILCLLPVCVYASRTDRSEKSKKSFVKTQIQQRSANFSFRSSTIFLLDSVHLYITKEKEIPDLVYYFEYDEQHRLSVAYHEEDWDADGVMDRVKEEIFYKNEESTDPGTILISVQRGTTWEEWFKIEYKYNEAGYIISEKQYDIFEDEWYVYYEETGVEFDEAGRVIRAEISDGFNNYIKNNDYSLSGQLDISETHVVFDDQTTARYELITYEYNEAGLVETISIYRDEEWEIVSIEHFEYDEHGNRTKVIEQSWYSSGIYTYIYKNFYSEMTPTAVTTPREEPAMQMSYNPAGGVITISLPAAEKGVVRIIDMAGQTIRQILFTGTTTQMAVNDIPSGIYIVQISAGPHNKNYKIRIR